VRDGVGEEASEGGRARESGRERGGGRGRGRESESGRGRGRGRESESGRGRESGRESESGREGESGRGRGASLDPATDLLKLVDTFRRAARCSSCSPRSTTAWQKIPREWFPW
jgi:hypothetical protein